MCKKLLLLGALAFVCAPVFAAVDDFVGASDDVVTAAPLRKAKKKGAVKGNIAPRTRNTKGTRTKGAHSENKGKGYAYGRKKQFKGKGYAYGRGTSDQSGRTAKMARILPAE